METTNNHIEQEQEVYELALRALLTEEEEIQASTNTLHNLLTERVVFLLSKNPERLMSILYRIDVQENQVNDIMKNAPVGAIASRIALLILERMKQKVETRRAYKNTKDNE